MDNKSFNQVHSIYIISPPLRCYLYYLNSFKKIFETYFTEQATGNHVSKQELLYFGQILDGLFTTLLSFALLTGPDFCLKFIKSVYLDEISIFETNHPIFSLRTPPFRVVYMRFHFSPENGPLGR